MVNKDQKFTVLKSCGKILKYPNSFEISTIRFTGLYLRVQSPLEETTIKF